MSAFDPATALETLAAEYAARAAAIRRDLARSHSPDFAEQAVQRQNDEVLEGLLAEAEAGMRPCPPAPGGRSLRPVRALRRGHRTGAPGRPACGGILPALRRPGTSVR